MRKQFNRISTFILLLSLGGVFKAQAAGAPTINSANILATSSTTATAEATVWPNGYATTVTLQYSLQAGFTSGLQTVALGTISATAEISETKSAIITGLLPGRLYYVRIRAYNLGGDVYTSSNNAIITPAAPSTLPVLSNVSSTIISATSAQIHYSIIPNLATSVWVQYGLNSNFVTGLITSPLVTIPAGNAAVNQTVTLNNLTEGATYYYRIRANNGAEDVYSTPQSFTPIVNRLITEYNFNNTYSNTLGTNPFGSTNTGTSFVADRTGTLSSALYFNALAPNSPIATISTLPVGNLPRSVAVWVKKEELNTDDQIFVYGTPTTNRAYGLSIQPTTVNNYGYANDHNPAFVFTLNTWHHLVTTYNDAGLSSIYVDGTLVNAMTKTAWNTVGTTFYLGGPLAGGNSFKGTIDDLKIYNYALTSTEINALYNGITTSISDTKEYELNLIYPNPAKDILHVSGSAEIFDLVGNKVASGSNEINIEHLLSGIYVVKANGKSQKIVKE